MSLSAYSMSGIVPGVFLLDLNSARYSSHFIDGKTGSKGGTLCGLSQVARGT